MRVLQKGFGNAKDTLPEIAKPLNPTASTRKEMATPLVCEKPTTSSKVASMPKPANGNSRGEMSRSCQSAQVHEFIKSESSINISVHLSFLGHKSWHRAYNVMQVFLDHVTMLLLPRCPLSLLTLSWCTMNTEQSR